MFLLLNNITYSSIAILYMCTQFCKYVIALVTCLNNPKKWQLYCRNIPDSIIYSLVSAICYDSY
jgi:hypothetical protein